jgi:hypothetical protein
MERTQEVSQHILPTSATMLGVCVTVLSIGKLAPPGTLHWLFDKLLGLASLAFLASAVLSFVSIRSRAQGGRLEGLAESVFLAALVLLGGVTLVIVFAFA